MINGQDMDEWMTRIVNIGTLITWAVMIGSWAKKKLRKFFRRGKHERK